MITVFNRAVLSREPNGEAAAKIRSTLKDAGIPFKVKIDGVRSPKPAVRIPNTGRTGVIGSGYSGGGYMAGGVPNSWMEGGTDKSFSVIYVLRKDLKRAKELCGI